MRRLAAVFCAIIFSAVFFVAFPAVAHQNPPAKQPARSQPRKVPEPPKFLGSEERLARQNAVADQYGLSRAEKDEEVADFIVKNGLAPMPGSGRGYVVTAEERFRFVFPDTREYIEQLSATYFARFGEPLKISSLLRTREYQMLLVRWRISDADCRTDSRCSVHLTGTAFDISKLDIYRRSKRQEKIRWLRLQLVNDWLAGKIDPIDEITNFHIMVIPKAAPQLDRESR